MSVKCIFCGSEEIGEASFPRSTRFNGKVFNYMSCKKCDLIFLNPLPVEDDYVAMYPVAYHDEAYFKEVPRNYDTLHGYIKKVSSNAKTVLDYGCGDADFLRYMADKGYEGTGAEFNPKLVDRLNASFQNIKFKTIDDFWNNDKTLYDVINLGDVLEHITAPKDLLEKLSTKLSADGILVVAGPIENNFTLGLVLRKFTSDTFRKNVVADHTPHHIFYSNASNQQLVFKLAGFQQQFFKITEMLWPYPEQFSFHPVTAVQYLLGQLSILYSKTNPTKIGNRFTYIGRKQQ